MPDFRFDTVDVLVVDPDANARRSIRNILHNNGFDDVRICGSAGEMHVHFEAEVPDLLICDADLPDEKLGTICHGIRHNEIGTNPFMALIALTWTPTREVVKEVINSGADDLVTKPIASGHLLDRIRLLIEARKPFVVTSDYVGPDRHRSSVRDTKIPLVEVPNLLKAKATGDKNIADVLMAIDVSASMVNQTKLEQHAVQVVGIVGMIAPKLESGTPVEPVVGKLLDRLLSVAEDTKQRLKGTPYEHVSELCQSLITVTRSLNASRHSPKPKDVKLLRPLSQAIQAAFAESVDTAAAARMISASIGDRDFFDPGKPASAPSAAAPNPPQATPPAAQPAAAQPAAAPKRSERRYLFLLRLFISRVSHLFKSSGARKQAIPRQFVHGFDKYLNMLLGPSLYEQLNNEARKLLDAIGTDDDALIWREVLMNEQFRVFSLNILVRILLQFRNFKRSKQQFLSIVNSAIAESGTDLFSDRHFSMVFSSLFSDIFGIIGDANERADLDVMMGEGTSERIRQIQEAHKKEMSESLGAVFGEENDFFQ